ncbi:serine/threonine protein phosphatase PrpC [Dysgonomonadaceae bacterium PH5-43]|nr:serine/threonine protein phosphatase PrpC [Dysgonomonadaceae bacterium PH5-43]
MNEIKFKLIAGTDIGLERSNNEDNFVVCTDLQTTEWFIPQDVDEPLVLSDKGCLLAVADGMGGMNAGEIASSIAIETVKKMFDPSLLTEQITKDANSITTYLKKIINEADQAIKNHSQTNESNRGMGTTIAIAWVLDRYAYLAWCGDSRIYSYHPKVGLRQLSKDHSYVQQLIDDGRLDPKYAFDHPDGNIILRSLGDTEKKAVADTLVYQLSNEEILLLCSDGLSGLCRDSDLEEIIKDNYANLTSCKTELIQAALSAGGYDNITVALFQQVSGGKDFEPVVDKGNSVINKFYRKIIWIIIVFLLITLVGVISLNYRMRHVEFSDKTAITIDVDTTQVNDLDSLQKETDSIRIISKPIINNKKEEGKPPKIIEQQKNPIKEDKVQNEITLIVEENIESELTISSDSIPEKQQ